MTRRVVIEIDSVRLGPGTTGSAREMEHALSQILTDRLQGGAGGASEMDQLGTRIADEIRGAQPDGGEGPA